MLLLLLLSPASSVCLALFFDHYLYFVFLNLNIDYMDEGVADPCGLRIRVVEEGGT